MDTEPGLRLEKRPAPATGAAGGLKLVFKGSSVKQLLSSGSKRQGGSWRQDGGSEQQDATSPSQGNAAVSDSPGRPFSPSSAEGSPVAVAEAAAAAAGAAARRAGSADAGWAGPRSIHGQPPGKQPYPHDRTPEAEAARAQLQPRRAGDDASGSQVDRPSVEGDGVAAGPRSVHSKPPGKQPHPDDPAFKPGGLAAAAGWQQQQLGHSEGQAGQHDDPEEQHLGHAFGAAAGPRSLHGQPPGKQPDQIQQIAASAKVESQEDDDDEEEEEEEFLGRHRHAAAAATGMLPQPPWRQQAQSAPQSFGPAPAGSSHQAKQRSATPSVAAAGKPPSRKRPASQAAGEGGQRKKAANGATAGGSGAIGGPPRQTAGTSGAGPFPSSAAASAQPIRAMPGAPRSLQQRQQLMNGALAGAARPAGAPRPKPPPGAAATKPKPPASKAGGGGQRKQSGGGGGAAAGSSLPPGTLPASHYKPGDVVWAKIGNYPWWPAQLQKPTADEHFKPKHAPSDLFCVFYGSNDYNWLPATALKPFVETHPDYIKHASVKNKTLQRAIDQAWVYGMQRQRPDVKFAPY